MDKDQKLQLEKQCIRDLMEYFANHKLNMEGLRWIEWQRACKDSVTTVTVNMILPNNKTKQVTYDFTDMYIIRQSIEQILKLELEELGIKYDPNLNDEKNEFLLKFLYSKTDGKEDVGGFTGGHNGEKNVIKIYENLAYERLQSDDPEVRISGCKDLFQTIFHEIQHYRQFLMMQSPVSSMESLIYAREQCLIELLDKVFYSSDKDKGNYEYFSIENNANAVGYRKVNSILEQEDLDFKKLEKFELDKFYNGSFVVNIDARYGHKHFEDERNRIKNDVATEILDEIITPSLIKQYPILLKEYHLDGTRRNAVELILNLDNEIKQITSLQGLKEKDKNDLIKDANMMYYELIFQALKKDPKTNVEDMKKYIGRDRSIQILDEISNYIKEENIRCVGITQSFYETCEPYLENNQKEQEEDIENVNRYFARRQDVLSQIYKQMYELTPESICEATKKAEISKSEIDQVIIDIRHAEQALKIKDSSLEERN